MRRPQVAFFAVLTLGASFTTLLSLTACYGDVAHDSPGDPPVDAGPPSALGAGMRLSTIIPTTELDGAPNPDHPAADASVSLTGESLIVIDQFDETQNGKSIGAVYVQDINPAPTAAMAKICGACVPGNSGVQLYEPNYSPPNLLVGPGDVLDMVGLYQDYSYSGFPKYGGIQASQPEIYKPIVTFRFEYSAPQPTIIKASDLQNDNNLGPSRALGLFETGHQWMSMLVEVDDVDISFSTPDGLGRQALAFTPDTSTDAPTISNELFNLNPADYGCPVTPLGISASKIAGPCKDSSKTHLKKLIGIVTYFYSFHIAPRSAADLVR